MPLMRFIISLISHFIFPLYLCYLLSFLFPVIYLCFVVISLLLPISLTIKYMKVLKNSRVIRTSIELITGEEEVISFAIIYSFIDNIIQWAFLSYKLGEIQ